MPFNDTRRDSKYNLNIILIMKNTKIFFKINILSLIYKPIKKIYKSIIVATSLNHVLNCIISLLFLFSVEFDK